MPDSRGRRGRAGDNLTGNEALASPAVAGISVSNICECHGSRPAVSQSAPAGQADQACARSGAMSAQRRVPLNPMIVSDQIG